MLNDRRVNFALLQETFWDKAYIDGIKHMFEGKIYECNGTNGRQGVAIMVSNESSELCFGLLPLSKFERVVLKSPPIIIFSRFSIYCLTILKYFILME
jgi:hypothetical protein